MSSPPGFAHFVSLLLPPHRGRHRRPGKAGSAVSRELAVPVSWAVGRAAARWGTELTIRCTRELREDDQPGSSTLLTTWITPFDW
jgi:hypothetical protein